MDEHREKLEKEVAELKGLCKYLENEVDYLNKKVNSFQQVYADIFTELFINDRAFRNALIEVGGEFGMDFSRALDENHYQYSKERVRDIIHDGLRKTIGKKFQDYFKTLL
ncbi:MAG: hypothetical protein ACYS8W_19040 [Planctomycetota bacterium]|jgi:hypothetical protein